MSIELYDHWEFRELGKETWNTATVPGSVHTDLLALGIIEDPYYRLNEHDVQWIDKKDWEYKTSFQLSDNIIMKGVYRKQRSCRFTLKVFILRANTEPEVICS